MMPKNTNQTKNLDKSGSDNRFLNSKIFNYLNKIYSNSILVKFIAKDLF